MISTFDLPPTTNNLYANKRGGGRRLTEEGKAYKDAVMKQLMTEGARSRTPRLPIVFSLWLLFPDRHRRDASNHVKIIEDAICSYLLYDDSRHHVLHVYKAMDRRRPRAVVLLEHKTEPIPEPPDLRKEIA
jgi:Holliday junction resolvase RusA-like endonuclease